MKLYRVIDRSDEAGQTGPLHASIGCAHAEYVELVAQGKACAIRTWPMFELLEEFVPGEPSRLKAERRKGMTRFGKTVQEALNGSQLKSHERGAVVAAVEGMAQIIATSSPEVVREIEAHMREVHGTAAWKILAWAAKDVHYEK